MLPNQTWVCSAAHSKAHLLTPSCGEGKCSVYWRAYKTRGPGTWCSEGPNSPKGFQGKIFKDSVWERVAGYVIRSWTFFWLVDGEVTGSQHHQPFGSSWSGVYVLVGSTQLTSPTWWGFQYLQNSSKDLAQKIICSPWRGTEGPWVCLMAKLLLFCLAWLLSFVPAFSHFSD